MKQYRLEEFGGCGDNLFDNSDVFRRAFEAIAEGGTLVIGPGVYRTGPLHLKATGCTVRFEEGATLSFIAEAERYRPVYTRWEGVDCWALHPLFLITDSHDLTIEGPGLLDGNGSWWWKEQRYKKDHQSGPESAIERELAALNPSYQSQSGGGGGRPIQFLRPPLVQLYKSSHIVINGLKLTNSPFWTLHPLYSSHLLIEQVTIENPSDAPNTDGIDIESCAHVVVRGCTVTVGDDGIALKSGSGQSGIESGVATTDVLIEECTVHHAHGGAVIGSETAAGFANITVRNCLFDGTDRGIRIKTRRGRGGRIRDLTFTDLTMRNNYCALAINMYYRCGSNDEEEFSLDERPLLDTTPSIERVHIERCHATRSRASAAFIVGLPEAPIKDLVVKDCSFGIASEHLVDIDESEMYAGLPRIEERGMRLRNAHLDLDRVTVDGARRALIIEEGVVLKDNS
ncbi:MAG TPA: glycoside hydrolase family 28 protein [Sphaerochaeta sp.]|mgnify:CR=1 FL=1|nr:glycoside hydrolase family 28 protein [Sphaerochaeta sp.]